MGRVIQFSNRPKCPPHDWVPIYEDDLISVVIDGVDETEHIIAGRICVKCSLIESKESLALMLGMGGKGKGFLSLTIRPTFCDCAPNYK